MSNAEKNTNIEEQLTAVRYRIYPTPEQEQFFRRTCGCVRKYHNLALADRNKMYEVYKTLSEEDKKDFSFFINYPTVYKSMEEYSYLKEADSLALSNARLFLKQSFEDFFNHKSGYPKFKKKGVHDSYMTNNQNGTVYFSDNGKVIKLPKLKTMVRVKKHRKIDGLIKSVTVTLEPTGKCYISVLYVVKKSKPEPAKTKKAVGIDFGLRNFITDSEGEKKDSLRFLRDMEVKLAKEQRKMSLKAERAKKDGRRLSDSKNYQKQKRKVAKIHEKIRNRRQDYLHKESRFYINTYDVICIEDLNIEGMKKQRSDAKAVSDAGWSMFVRMLEYKAKWCGKQVVKVSRWFPSTQTCSECGYRNTGKNKLKRNVEEWDCPVCGKHHDRDINAAINIRNEGLRILQSS